MLDTISIEKQVREQLSTINTESDLNALRIKYLGKAGAVSELLKGIKDIEPSGKKAYGEMVNALKNNVEAMIEKKTAELASAKITALLENAKMIDLTIPSQGEMGSLHPITVTTQKIVEIFKSMGFVFEQSNEVETEFNNFEAVNVPKNHPARDMQDTFYLSNGQVLSTHTSSSQNRVMKKYGAPLKAVFPGRCFRNEELDASHENTFFQLEGMVMDKNISIANLVYFMRQMLQSVFQKDLQVRLRPGFFPFVEPGFELDCSCIYCEGKGCKVCKQSGWIELCPCGMIHPAVLEMGGVNPNEYQGFAFGLGLSRLAMMMYNIDDIRVMNSGNLKQLKQIKIK